MSYVVWVVILCTGHSCVHVALPSEEECAKLALQHKVAPSECRPVTMWGRTANAR
jgi:hypothetical protein